MADINLPECCEKVLGLGAAEIREEREKGQISQMEFLLVFTSKKKKKSLYAVWCLGLRNMFTSSSFSSHVP